MGQIIVFPFVGGAETGTDRAVLADGKLADAQNCELDRLGRLRVRAGYTAQPTTTFRGAQALVAYDLFALNDRLFALADANGRGFPNDIFEYFGTGLAATWKPTSTTNGTLARLPRATRVRELAQPPDSPGGISNMGCAAFAGFAALVWNSSDVPTDGWVQVVQAVQNQPVVYERLDITPPHPCQLLRAVGLSDRLFIVGVNFAALQVSLARWTPASDKTVQQVASLITSVNAITSIATCKVGGVDQFCVAVNLGGVTGIRIRRYDNTGTLIVPSGGQYADINTASNQLQIAADSTANRLVVMWTLGSPTQARCAVYNLSTGAAITGTLSPLTTTTVGEISIGPDTSNSWFLYGTSSAATPVPVILRNSVDLTTGAVGSPNVWITDASLCSNVLNVLNNDDTLIAVRQGAPTVGGSPNMLLSSGQTRTTPQIVKDLEVSGFTPVSATTPNVMLPDLTKDASTGKFYWCNAIASPDGAATPLITEFSYGEAFRRQVSQMGNIAYIAGGCPLAFDGATVVESGFLTRPRILSLTPSTAAGALLGGTVYDYRVHAEWVDSDNRLHLSPPSIISTVTLGATDNTVTAVCATHHSMRVNQGADSAGSEIRYVLSRTESTRSTTAAHTTGSAALDSPPGTLNGETLLISYFNNGALNSVSCIFVGADLVSFATLLAKINGSSIGTVITASSAGGLLLLTANVTGSTQSFLVLGASTAAADLGLTTGVSFVGTTTITKGQNFQRAATGFTQSGIVTGTPITIVDTRKDESSPIVDTDLIRQAVLYSQGVDSGAHHAPLPAEYTWSSRDRVVNGGLPRRSIVQASKTQATNEPAEYAFEGFEAFLSSVRGDVQAVALVGDSIAVWTRREIWLISGSGPNRSGQGEFFAPTRISASGGMLKDGWRSVAECDLGLFFQLNGDKIYLLTHSGNLTWIGRDAQDYLTQFPVVTCAIHSIAKHSMIFGLTNAAGNAGGLLRYDLEAHPASVASSGASVGASGAWFFDPVGAVTALAEFGERVAYVQAGVVFLQDTAVGLGTFVSMRVASGMFQGFQSLGWGAINKIGFGATWVSDCTVEAFIDYADGAGFKTLGQFALTAANGYVAGQSATVLWDPQLQKLDQFAVRYVVTSGTSGEGIQLNSHAFDVDRAPELSRQGAAFNN